MGAMQVLQPSTIQNETEWDPAAFTLLNAFSGVCFAPELITVNETEL